MFTKCEKRMILAILIMNISFALGVYTIYVKTFTIDILSAILGSWSLGLGVFFGSLLVHFLERNNRIIVKDN